MKKKLKEILFPKESSFFVFERRGDREYTSRQWNALPGMPGKRSDEEIIKKSLKNLFLSSFLGP